MTQPNDNDVAIVGMALRVPGATTPEQFWRNLTGGVESLQTYSADELLARGIPKATLSRADYVRAGMPLPGMEEFDPEFFGFSPKEAAILDPQHRQFYEVAWEALERAGHPPSRFEGNIGVFAGSGMAAYFAQNLLTNPDLLDSVGLFLLRHTGNDKDFLATRVSYAFDLKGPSVNVQTACSTSLVATHLAVQSLLSGESDMALAGGVTIELPHRVGYHYKEGEILSPDGHCRTFDHRAKGTVFGSGVGVVVLRRLGDALNDGDHVHAVIKGSAVNNDGAGKVGYLAPSVGGQAAAVAEALAIAGVDAETIDYVECHGTATPVGDPIEITALSQAFRETTDKAGYCRVGSVKSNIGHLDTAAGVVGLIKAALAVEHGTIPPTLHFEAPNPAIPFDGSPFVVAAQAEPWPDAGRPRRAAVNSLGVGGTNAFAVLEQAPAAPALPDETAPQLLVMSAKNRRALDAYAARLADWLEAHPEQPLADVAYTLLSGREKFEHGRVLAARDRTEAVALLREPDARRVFNHRLEVENPRVVFMFPGGGAQYPAMGRGLYDHEPLFRENIDRGLALLRDKHGVDLAPIFFADGASAAADLSRPSVQLPLIFLVEYALTRVWQAYGVEPGALIGHSLGENTAACVAGVMSFEDALGLVLLRGQLMDRAPKGTMLSVAMPADELMPLLGDDLDLAASNSAQLSVASGSLDAIAGLSERLTAAGVDFQRVKIDIAAHSRLLDDALPAFRSYLQSIELHEPALPIVSNVNGEWLTADQATDPEYWVRHLRSTVRFADGVQTLLQGQDPVFLEAGPGSILGSFVRQARAAPGQRVFSSMRHPDDTNSDVAHFRAVIGRLWAVGVEPDTQRLWPQPRRTVPLPTYAFQHAAYWIEPGRGNAEQAPDVLNPEKVDDVARWFSEPRWVQRGIADFTREAASWLVFHAGDPLTSELIGRMRARGDTVITVQAGDTFAQLDEHSFMIAPEAGGVGYKDLIGALHDAGTLPDRILHTWLYTPTEVHRPGSTFFHRNQEYGFYSLMYLAQALGRVGADDTPMHLVVVTNGAQRVDVESLPYPDKATALGPVSVIPREYPNVTCRLVDLEGPAQTTNGKRRREAAAAYAPQALSALLEETAAAPCRGVFAWRGPVRWERYLRPMDPDRAAAPADRLRSGGVYLITGGYGGISGVIGEWLAREFRARLILLARTPVPARDDWDDWLAAHGQDDSISQAIHRIQHLEALGAQVLPVAADVTVQEQVADAVRLARETFGEIHGVFHTAGALRDSLIQLKGQKDVEEVFSAKVYGTQVLDQVFEGSALDFMVLFSSTSAFVAPQGQIDYVAANSFINAFADSRSGQRAYPVAAVNWGIWRDVGMARLPGTSSQSRTEHPLVAEARHGREAPLSDPTFDSHLVLRESTKQVHLLSGTLSATEDWVVDEHRLASGEALLPGTGHAELIRAALHEIGIAEPWKLRNLSFLAPLFVPEDAGRRFCVRLEGNAALWQAAVYAQDARADEPDQWVQCAAARVDARDVCEPAAFDAGAVRSRCTAAHEKAGGSGALRTRQENHLRFGPRWQTLRQIDLGAREAIAHLTLPEAHTADLSEHPLHPALLDIATGCAMDLIPGYTDQGGTSLWAPLSYAELVYRRPLPADVQSWVRLADVPAGEHGTAAFDVTLADAAGNVVAEVRQLTLRRIEATLAPAAGSQAQPAADAGDAPRVKPPSPAEAVLQHNLSQGIGNDEGVDALRRLLAWPNPPSTLVVSSIELPMLLAQADAVSRAGDARSDARFSRPQLDNEYEAPRNDTEQALSEIWGRLLGVEGIGIKDNFFDLGGHSLVAVRLFNELSERFDVDLPMSVLMQSPTIEALAGLIRPAEPADAASADAGAPDRAQPAQEERFEFIVPMHTGPVAGATPLFMVAGMFGNVLNLSHLAHLLGEDRPFYAIQARGLYGDASPHETFEDMAADYLVEIRRVQPSGPYLLGGFSGGGITAYEIARQLLDAGEQVSLVIMLDTPLPQNLPLSLPDRLAMFAQSLRADGLGVVRQKISQRISWEREKRRGVLPLPESARSPAPLSFQSQKVGEAFVRAHARYRTPKLPVSVALFRPRLNVRYRLSGGRLLSADRQPLREDNFWTPYVEHLHVVEVPGNHDSMVLEPNVRVLVANIRKALDSVQ